jgi:diketogulonate reductase-like aldo/keto reductase
MKRRDLFLGPAVALGLSRAGQAAPAATPTAAAAVSVPQAPAASADAGWRKPIPRSGEALPVVGLGTWITFNIGRDAAERASRQRVLERFLAAGGGMIDSSPMYGSAEQVVGELLGPAAAAAPGGRVFAATKVWTPLDRVGAQQHRDSLRLWKRSTLDLQQVHNLLNWKPHLALLRAERERGSVRYIGVTTSHGARHAEMERMLRSEPLDFLQITYNPVDESAEPLMQLAADRGMAVIVNRPFDGGALLQRLAGRPLPAVARDLGCQTWAAAALKWEVSHPAVTCAIPATSNPDHLDQNMAALRGPVPTAAQRAQLRAALRA